MLPRTAKEILNNLIDTDFVFNSTDEIAEELCLDKQEVIDNLLYLQDEGYINCIDSDDDVLYICPLHKGRYYYEVRAAEIKDFLFRSIFTPIIVSILTTFLTMFCTKIISNMIK